jgi:hypothetical protein
MIFTAMWLSKPIWEETKAIAAEEDRSAASVVREALTLYLNRRAAEPARRPTKRRK